MPNYAVIENGKVVNMCVASPEDKKPDNWVLCENGGIGWDYVDGQFVDNRVFPSVDIEVVPVQVTKEELLNQISILAEKIKSLE